MSTKSKARMLRRHPIPQNEPEITGAIATALLSLITLGAIEDESEDDTSNPTDAE